MNAHRRHGGHRHGSRIAVGAIIIVVGVLALLGNLGILDTHNLAQFWPALFAVFGVLKLFRARHAGGYAVGAALIAVGTLMTLNNVGIIHFRMRDWWPVFLIFAGVLMLFKGRSRDRRGGDSMSAIEQVMHSDRLNTSAIMSGAKVKSDAQNFRGGELTAVMGGIELDLRQASIEGEAVLDVFALWGGISIKVPTDWSIVLNGVPILGGIDDKTLPPMNSTKRLIIAGEVIMGGVEIRN
jgi:predicted membrane protein